MSHGRSSGAANNKQPAFRSRKIDVRRALPVLRESDLGDREDLALAQLVPAGATGVEKEEEEEEHLQLALQTHYGSDAKTFIPVPEADRPFEEYLDFYQKPFVLPKTLIRFSAPIEEFIGCPYNMDDEDDSWLAEHNAKCDRGELPKHARLTEDQFEELMWGLEKITQEKNWVDPWSNKFSPHLGEMATLEDLETYLKTASALLPASRQVIKHPNLKSAASAVFGHWSERRKARGSRPIQPTIKTDDTGENDAYICFRRREARPMRKTRRVDQQSMDKVRQLRQQMDQARNLLDLVTKRERYRKESLILEELIFQQKIIVRRMKKKLGVAANEDLSPLKKNPIRRDERAPGSTKIFIPVDKLRSVSHYSPMAASELAAESRKRKREEDERQGWLDLTENPHVPLPPAHPGDNFFREDYTELLSYPSPAAEDGVVPTFLVQPGQSVADLDVPFLPDKEMDDGRRETILRARLGRVRIGRGGRRMYDRRCAIADVFPELGPRHAWVPGEAESRWNRAPDFEMENEAKVRQEMQEKLSRFRWGDMDDEDLAITTDGAGMPIYDNTNALLLRYSLIGELDLKSLEVVPRIISQFEPRIGGTKNPQASIPPPQVIRPPPPAIQQQQQAAAAAKKKAAVTAARLSSDNLNSLASGQSSAQLAMKAGKPVKGEEDPKAAAVKMLMREAAKGAQQIQQMSSQLQQQAQMRNQQALQGSFQPQLQQALPLLAGQLGSQNAAQIIQGAQASMPAALGSPVMGNGQVQQQTPGSPALNGPMISPTKLASNQGVKNTLLAAGVLGSTPATSPGNSPAAALQGAQNAAALQQQAQRVQMIRSRQQQAAAAGGAQGSAALTQANVAAAQTMLLNQLRPGAQVKIPGTGNVQAMLSGANAAFAASNGVNSSPPRSNVSAAHVTPAMLAQLQARLAMAGNAGLLANAAAAGALNAGQHGGDGGAMDDDESK